MSATGGHLGSLQALTTMNSVAMSTQVQFLYGQGFSVRLGKYQGTRWLVLTWECDYFCKKPPRCPAKWPHCSASPPAVMTVSVAPHPHQHSVTSASVHASRGAWCQLLCTLIGVPWCQLLSILTGVCADSICLALMTYDVQHLLTGLCIICVSSLVRRLFGIWFIF